MILKMIDQQAYEEAQCCVENIHKNCKIKELEYIVEEARGKVLLDIIYTWGQNGLGNVLEKNKLDPQNPALLATFILINTVNKPIGKILHNFLEREPNLDDRILVLLEASKKSVSGD